MPEQAAISSAESARRHAAGRLGMMVFIASEAMLFAGMFGLYVAYRIAYPLDFAHGVAHDLRWAGSLNTYLLLLSSWCLAMAVVRLRDGRVAAPFLAGTMTLGVVFLAVKGYEYAEHLRHGLVPGAHGQAGHGGNAFIALYFLITGTHALHVIAGLILIAISWPLAARGRPQRLETVALYWHFVDLVWVFVWPLFYLVGGTRT